MTYATPADLEARLDPKHLTELADDDLDGVANAEVIEAALADASALIDTHLAGFYVLPLADPPAVLTKWCADLAVAALFERRREAASPGHAARAEEVRSLLDMLARGELLLAGLDGAMRRGKPTSTTQAEGKAFSRQTLRKY